MNDEQRIRIVRPDGTTVYLPRKNGRDVSHIQISRKPNPAPPEPPVPPTATPEPEPPKPEISLREENVQEVLTRVPHWMIRWGSTLIVLIIAVALLLMGLIEYPDVVTGPVRLSGGAPAQTISTEPGTRSTSLVPTGTTVTLGTPVLLRETRAEYTDVFLLRDRMDSVRLNSRELYFPIDELPVLYLGELQGAYQQFAVRYAHYRSQRKEADDTTVAALQAFDAAVAAFLELRVAIDEWETQHVVRAELTGKLRPAEGDGAGSGNTLRIEGMQQDGMQAWVRIAARGAGKVEPRQPVLIRLAKYPAEDFGVLTGVVAEIRPLEGDEQGYRVRVDFPQGNVTNYGRRIQLAHDLNGTAEIITERKTVLQRIFGRLQGG